VGSAGGKIVRVPQTRHQKGRMLASRRMKIHFAKTIFISALFCVAGVAQAQNFNVIGYTTYWSGAADDIAFDKLTHVNYAFALPNPDGSLHPLDNPAKLRSLVERGKKSNVQVFISVGGWMNGDPGPFVKLTADSASRKIFIRSLTDLLDQYALDGVDIDWEHPTPATSELYETLMGELSDALHSRGKKLTSAVVGHAGGGDAIPARVFDAVDWLNVMAYDLNKFDHSTYDQALAAVAYWRKRGLPASKLVLGVPFYGKPSEQSFAKLVSLGADPNADVWQDQGYNGLATIRRKTNLCFDRGLGGIMMWELAHDTPGEHSLLGAIDEMVKKRKDRGKGAR
jgi:chitinase